MNESSYSLLLGISAYNVFAHTLLPVAPHVGYCAGTPSSALVGLAVVASYLVLFVDFFNQTYTKKPKAIASHMTQGLI